MTKLVSASPSFDTWAALPAQGGVVGVSVQGLGLHWVIPVGSSS